MLIVVLTLIYLSAYLLSSLSSSIAESWWRFLPSFVAFLGTAYLFKKREFSTYLGLIRPNRSDVLIGAFLICVAIGFALFILPKMLLEKGITTVMTPFYWERLFITPPHVIMEEMLFRALLLTALINAFSRPIFMSVILAVTFAGAHELNYAYLRNDLSLTWICLFSLFNLALALNLFFLKRRSLYIPILVHLSWNFFRFNNKWSYSDSQSLLTEAESFNQIEGDALVLSLSVFLLVLSITYYRFAKNDPVLKTL